MTKYLDTTGLSYFWSKIKNLLADKIGKNDVATSSEYGVVKLNPDEDVTLNSSGQLKVGGRLGQMDGTTGIYSPSSISPSSVGNGSLLITEASGTTLGNKSLSVSTGMNLTLNKSHAAGSTSYTVKNNYINRILCTIALGGRACLNESSSGNTVSITSINVGGSQVSPSSTDSSTVITITTSESVNPNNSTSQIRIYPKQEGFSNLIFGVSRTGNNGYSIVGGQQVGNASNASAVFGNTQYNTGNSSLLAGRQHINTKQNAFLAGIGHDTTYGTTEVVALGKWSNVKSDTALAFGGGTSNTSRSNILEITTAGDATFREDVNVGRDLTVTGETHLNGTATAPTPNSEDNSNKIATTEFVQSALSGGSSHKVGDIITTVGSDPPLDGEWIPLDGRVLDPSEYPELYKLYPYNSEITTDNTFTIPNVSSKLYGNLELVSISEVNEYIVAFTYRHMCYREKNSSQWTVRDISSLVPTDSSSNYPNYIQQAYIYYDEKSSLYLLSIYTNMYGYSTTHRYGLYKMTSLGGTITTIFSNDIINTNYANEGKVIRPIYKVGDYYCAHFSFTNNNSYGVDNKTYVTKNPNGTWTNLEDYNISNPLTTKLSYIYYYDNRYILCGTYYNTTTKISNPAIAIGVKNADLIDNTFSLKVIPLDDYSPSSSTNTGYFPHIMKVLFLEDKNLFCLLVDHQANLTTTYQPIFTKDFDQFKNLTSKYNNLKIYNGSTYLSPYLYYDDWYSNVGQRILKVHNENACIEISVSSTQIFYPFNALLFTNDYGIKVKRSSTGTYNVIFTEWSLFKTMPTKVDSTDIKYGTYYIKAKD